jgi:hypothetical protein
VTRKKQLRQSDKINGRIEFKLGWALTLAGGFEDCQQLFVDRVVAGHDMPCGENVFATFGVGDETAGFAHQD